MTIETEYQSDIGIPKRFKIGPATILTSKELLNNVKVVTFYIVSSSKFCDLCLLSVILSSLAHFKLIEFTCRLSENGNDH